jgi:uncharacterized protein
MAEVRRPPSIDAYGGGGFRVDGESIRGSVIVLPERVVAWGVSEAGGITLESLQPVVEAAGEVEILLIGTGARFTLVSPALRQTLRSEASRRTPWTPVLPAAPTTSCAPRDAASPRP